MVPAMINEAIHHDWRQHLQRVWSGGDHDELAWRLGPVDDVLPRLRIRRITPEKPGEPWVFATVGAWEAVDSLDRLEFILLTPDERAEYLELLTMLACFHADPRFSLRFGGTVNIGRPWTDDSRAHELYVSPAYCLPEDLRCHHCCDGGHIDIAWLVPVTPEEAALARSGRGDELEALLDLARANVVDPRRSSVVAV